MAKSKKPIEQICEIIHDNIMNLRQELGTEPTLANADQMNARLAGLELTIKDQVKQISIKSR